MKVYPAYQGRNPRKGQTVDVPEKRLPFFVGSSALFATTEGVPSAPDEWPMDGDERRGVLDVPGLAEACGWIQRELLAGRAVELSVGTLSIKPRPSGGRGPVFQAKVG